MDKIRVTGGIQLAGRIETSGAKNAALPAMVASLLTSETLELENVPYVRDILTTRKLLAEMVLNAESLCDDRLIVTWQTMSDRERLGAHQRGEDDLYRLLQTVKGNVVVALIREEGEGVFSVGLRSAPSVDVGAVAASFGGGGHRQAAGFDITGSLDSVKKTVMAALTPLVAGSSSAKSGSTASAEM